MKPLTFRSVVLVGGFSLLAGCGEEAAPVAPVAAVAAAKKKAEVVPVVAATEVDYAYNAINKRDPFRGNVEEGARGNSGPTPAGPECTDPLCLIDLDDLTVVAVVSGDANPLAMVEDRTGVGHLVRRNTRMGKQGGKVTQILRDCIVVTSFISGGSDGKPQANKQPMCVKTDTRSTPALDLFKNKEFIP